MNSSRRRILKVILAAGFWSTSGRAFAYQIQHTLDSETGSMLNGMFGNTESARAVGNAYLRANPNEADQQLLEGALFDSSSSDGRHAYQPGFRAAILSKVRGDYAFGRVVTVDGWILSLTEARLCALVTLSCP